MSEAVCACLRVEYDPVSQTDGTLSERWRCPSCGGRFSRQALIVRAADAVAPPRTVLPGLVAARPEPDRDMVVLGAFGLALIVGGAGGLMVGGPEYLIPLAFGAFLVVLSHGTILGRLRACREIVEQCGRVAP